MQFQVVDRVPCADLQRVLVVLEHQLRRGSGCEVERDGARIVVQGLGPSPRTINPRDRAVIVVQVEGGDAVIEADVYFQASSLAAPVGQEEVVRGKLLRLIGAARQQVEREMEWLEMERRERQAGGGLSSSSSSSAARIYAATGSGADVASSGAAAAPEGSAREEAARRETKHRAAANERKDAGATQGNAGQGSAGSGAAGPTAEVRERTLSESRTTGSSGGLPPVRGVSREHQLREALGMLDDEPEAGKPARPAALRSASESRSRTWMWAAAAAVLVVVAAVAWQMRPRAQAAAPAIDLTQAEPAKATRTAADASPEGALRQWELAMGSSDAAAQTAYYATPVEQYMWKRNVTRRELEEMKRGEIARRRGRWTVRIESVAIERNGNTATVKLVKHITVEPQGGGRPWERMVPSQLTLRNSLGIWWIVAEKDIYPKKKTGDEDEFNPEDGETPSWAAPSSSPSSPAAPSSVAAGATPSGSSTN